ncbi:MAG: ATP-binding protein [Syntrophales bacterium]|nr:ATP-binding protein [Syntrophales bacterium]
METVAAASDAGEGVAGRLRWLILLRVFIVSVLLGIAALIQVSGGEAISARALSLIFAIIGATFFLSFLYAVLARLWKNLTLTISLQAIIDVVMVTALVYVTGGVGSIYSILYPLVIIYGALFMGRRGALLVASLSAICYGGLLDLEYFGYVYPMYGETYYYSFSAGYVFSRIFIHIVFFYIIALLASFVVERERRATHLLSEREDSFKRLDLLHRSIIESVNVGIITIDRDRTVRSFNNAAEEITGRHRYQVVGRVLEDILPGISSVLFEGSESSTVLETTEVSPDGREMTLGCSLSPLMDPSMKPMGTIIIFQDLTAMKAMEKEVERSKKMAFLGEMSAVLAHELRNPLASIGGSIQLLRRDLFLAAGDRKLMDIIERGRGQLEALAVDFLLLARSKTRTRDDEIDSLEMVDEILESVRVGGDWNGDIQVVRHFDGQRMLRGNRTEVRQAILNVVTNSLQAMQDGGVLTVRTRALEGEAGVEGGFFEIEISDTGRGIDPADLKNVREPFFTTREAGTGLGLTIVDRVIDNHGGYFYIESETGKGTRAVMGFPCNLGARETGE